MSFWSAVGTLFGSINMLGAGLLIIAAAAAFGISRTLTKEKELWLPTITVFCWLGAMVLAATPEAATLYLIGALASTATYMQVFKHEKNERVNLLHIALIGLFINLSLTAGAYYLDNGVANQIDQSIAEGLLYDDNTQTNAWVSEYQHDSIQIKTGLCAPGEQNCSSSLRSGSIDSQNFDIISAVLNVGTGIEKAIKFAGFSVLGPAVLSKQVIAKINDPIMSALIFLLLNLWTLAIVYHSVMFLLNNRGA